MQGPNASTEDRKAIDSDNYELCIVCCRRNEDFRMTTARFRALLQLVGANVTHSLQCGIRRCCVQGSSQESYKSHGRPIGLFLLPKLSHTPLSLGDSKRMESISSTWGDIGLGPSHGENGGRQPRYPRDLQDHVLHMVTQLLCKGCTFVQTPMATVWKRKCFI